MCVWECLLHSRNKKEMTKNGNRAERRRNPLSDRTNSNPPPSSSVSSSSVECRAVGFPISEPISTTVIHTRTRTWNERKNQKKALTTPNIFNLRDKNNVAEGLNLSEAKPLAVPCRKKQRAVAGEGNALRDFIEQQKAYYKEIDEFELAEEEVESIYELE